ncbi:hypothetical protein [Pseudomonas sp. RC3H12]|uniref:hypothetical protein n=1 Tax=Pseudomonas sp. RC3H12 TaxID=2834406 RepID=UPI001BDF5248|nr:hypothetical protein [Pseudomonas sp. RC3H12]QWA27815.1 hypothetical protein KHO27_18045 [Pseudomonas sp. RC3H12]
MLLRIVPLVLSGDYRLGLVAVVRRMRGVLLDCSNSWSINAPAELLRSNLILELGPIDEQLEIRDLCGIS